MGMDIKVGVGVEAGGGVLISAPAGSSHQGRLEPTPSFFGRVDSPAP